MNTESLDDLIEYFNRGLCRGTKQFHCEPCDRERYEAIRQIFSAPSTPPEADWEVTWVSDSVLFFKMKGRP